MEMDWLEDFQDNFKHLDWVKNLKGKKFIGNVQLNFFKGEVLKINKTISAPKRKSKEVKIEEKRSVHK